MRNFVHQAAAVIVTHAHGCLTAAGHGYVMLGTIKFVDKSVNDKSARRLDHCDVIASRSGFSVPTGVLHSEVELQTEFKSFAAAHLGSNTATDNHHHSDVIMSEMASQITSVSIVCLDVCLGGY